MAYDLIGAGFTALRPRWGDTLGRMAAHIQTPGRLFLALAVATSAAHLAFEYPFGGMTWSHWGPFYVQTSRILLYFAYFVFGIALGTHGLEIGVLAADGPLAKEWKRWAAYAPIGLVAAIGVFILAFRVQPLPAYLHVLIVVAYTMGGLTMCMGAIAIFLRFARLPHPVFAAMVPCAFGIYVVHYAVVSHLQYLLLGVALPGMVKGLLVIAGAVAISWGLVAALRKVPGVARVI